MSDLTYESAKKSRSPRVWPGCKGEGCCRPCGGIHDFQGYGWNDKGQRVVTHNFRCLQNSNMGCPDPKPAPEHDYNRAGNCRVCGISRAFSERNNVAARSASEEKRP